MNILLSTLPWLITLIIPLAILIYFISLFSRLVRAVEKIAEKNG